MHIAFLTLFLGLVSGRVPVELAATGAPAAPAASATSAITAIELVLDGAPAGRLAGPPWKGQIDFGKDLLPHHLVARELGEQGEEVARAEQWVNLPRPPAEVEAVPQPGPDGRIAMVRLTFQSLTRESPVKVSALFDGSPLPVQGERIALPPYSVEAGHLLSIEAAYSSGLTARRDLAFGFGGEVSTDLTAVPVRLLGRTRLPASPAALAGWFHEGGQALRPVAVEEGPAELIVVRAPGAPPLLQEIGTAGLRARHAHGLGVPDPDVHQLKGALSLGPAVRVRFLHPTAQRFSDTRLASELFPSSQDFTPKDGGLFWLLAGVVQEEKGETRFADAVAVAGIQALTANHRRAVLLVLDGTTADASRYDPATVRRYLAAIHVPLYVWSLRKPPYPTATEAWGTVENASVLSRLHNAFDRLASDLERQRIVWLDGRHLPQAITLSPAAGKGVELAAAPGG
jgi:hypothetical protein